jgi:PleD family two-component response regulator
MPAALRQCPTTGCDESVNLDSPYPRPPLVLIVTAQEWVSLSMVTVFSPKGYAVLRSFNGSQALERVREAPPDLLVVDRELRDMTGLDFCAALRQQTGSGASVPVLLISSSPWPRDDKLDALREGAWDVCSLPMDSEEIFLKVDAWVRAKLANDVSRDQSLLDPDTGFYNAQGLLRRMAELGAGAVRHRRPLACVVLSAEPAAAGGAAEGQARGAADPWTAAEVKSFATSLRAAGRASDAIGRLSATEFVILAPDTDDEGVLGLATRLREAMEPSPAADTGWHMRFGCYAVPNLRDASIAPTEMLIRAAEALRAADARQETMRFFTHDPHAN